MYQKHRHPRQFHGIGASVVKPDNNVSKTLHGAGVSAPAKSRGSEKRWHAHLYGFRGFDNTGVGPATFEEEDAGADLVVMTSASVPPLEPSGGMRPLTGNGSIRFTL